MNQENDIHRVIRIEAEDPTNTTLDVLHFVDYLGIDLQIEPHLVWVAREILGSPMPPSAKLHVSSGGVVYFEDVITGHFTLEHPLTQRYVKVLEKARLETIVLKRYKNTRSLISSQPDVLFNKEYPHLQLPCQSCLSFQAAVKCEQCWQSFCEDCYKTLHNRGPRRFHSAVRTPIGAQCAGCVHPPAGDATAAAEGAALTARPDVFCSVCEEHFCMPCFARIHQKGSRAAHKAVVVTVSDSDVTAGAPVVCENCGERQANFRCDQCADFLCVGCFWRLHAGTANSNRSRHTSTKMGLTPICGFCEKEETEEGTFEGTRATVWCEQCLEVFCSECFTLQHAKGNRRLHLCADATNMPLLLETLDPKNRKLINDEIDVILRAIIKVQALVRGVQVRGLIRRVRQATRLANDRGEATAMEAVERYFDRQVPSTISKHKRALLEALGGEIQRLEE